MTWQEVKSNSDERSAQSAFFLICHIIDVFGTDTDKTNMIAYLEKNGFYINTRRTRPSDFIPYVTITRPVDMSWADIDFEEKGRIK